MSSACGSLAFTKLMPLPQGHISSISVSPSPYPTIFLPFSSDISGAHISGLSSLLPTPPSSPRLRTPVLPPRCPPPTRPPPHSPFYLPAHPEDLPARTGPDSSAPVCHPGSGPPVAVDGLAGGTIPLPAGPHLHQVLAVQEHRARRRAQHLSAALLLAQVAKTEPLSPRAKE